MCLVDNTRRFKFFLQFGINKELLEDKIWHPHKSIFTRKQSSSFLEKRLQQICKYYSFRLQSYVFLLSMKYVNQEASRVPHWAEIKHFTPEWYWQAFILRISARNDTINSLFELIIADSLKMKWDLNSATRELTFNLSSFEFRCIHHELILNPCSNLILQMLL